MALTFVFLVVRALGKRCVSGTEPTDSFVPSGMAFHNQHMPRSSKASQLAMRHDAAGLNSVVTPVITICVPMVARISPIRRVTALMALWPR